MKEVDELIERLNDAYTPESIFRRDVNSVIQRQVKDGQHWSILSSDIADGLIELGYVKVVRCGECKWARDVDESGVFCDMDAEFKPLTDYCSEGEPKEDTNDAV